MLSREQEFATDPSYMARATMSPAAELQAAFNVEVVKAQQRIAGRKDDSGKLDMTLFDDMPHALDAVCEVMQWAITKKVPAYERSSWLGVSPDRYRAAIQRHTNGANKQSSMLPKPVEGPDYGAPRFQRDEETHLLHLAHVACSALFALELTLREIKAGYNF